MADIGIVKTVLTGFSGAPGYTTLHFGKTGVLGWDYYAQKAIDHMVNAWTVMEPYIPTGEHMTVQSTVNVIDDLSGGLVDTFEGTEGANEGTYTGGFNPIASGVLISYSTGGVVNHHHVRGRTFIVPVGRNVGDSDGVIDPTVQTAMAGWFEALVDTADPNLHFGVYSRPFAPTLSHPVARAGSFWPATAGVVRSKLCVLRSRRD